MVVLWAIVLAVAFGPLLHNLARRIASAVSGIGAALVHTVLAIIIAGILMATFQGHARTVRGRVAAGR